MFFRQAHTLVYSSGTCVDEVGHELNSSSDSLNISDTQNSTANHPCFVLESVSVTPGDSEILTESVDNDSLERASALASLKSLLRFSYGLSAVTERTEGSGIQRILRRIREVRLVYCYSHRYC